MTKYSLFLFLLHISYGHQSYDLDGYGYEYYMPNYYHSARRYVRYPYPFPFLDPYYDYQYPDFQDNDNNDNDINYPDYDFKSEYRGGFASPKYKPLMSYRRANPFAFQNVADNYDPTRHRNWKLVNNEMCGEGTENRIIGGINAKLGQYPWIARIGYNKLSNSRIVFKCGGTLISNRFVVTAGHCVVNLPSSYILDIVRLGEHNVLTDIDCVDGECAERPHDYKVKKIIPHPLYAQPANSNDIALLKLNRAVVFTKWIKPICLPYGPLIMKNYIGSVVEVAGWGVYDITTKANSNILQTVKLPVLDTKVCQNSYKRYTIRVPLQMCVGGEVGRDSCQGDSGGPLMKVEQVHVDPPKYFFFGVVSFGATYCGMSPSPAVYTRVIGYLEWILDNISA